VDGEKIRAMYYCEKHRHRLLGRALSLQRDCKDITKLEEHFRRDGYLGFGPNGSSC
jgi:hypothetical protein